MAKKKSTAGGFSFDDDFAEENNMQKASDLAKQQKEYRVYSTGSFMLDCAIGEKDPIKGNGGIPERSIVEIFGKNSCMKTNFSENVIKSVLDDDPDNKVIVIYAEEPDMDRLEKMGVNLDRLVTMGCYINGDEAILQTAENHLDTVNRSVQDPSVKLVVIDSLKALCTAKQMYNKKGEIKELSEDEQMAVRAKIVGDFIRNFVVFNQRAILLMTNQISEQIGMNFDVDSKNKIKTPAGRYKEYMAHLRIEAVTRPIESEKEHPLFGKKLNLGWEVWYRLMKNKFSNSTSNRTVMSEFYFNPPGFRRGKEVLMCADYLGIINKGGGGNFTIKDKKIKGEPNVIKYLDANVEIRQQLEKEILLRSEELFNFKEEEDPDVDLLA